MPNRHARLAELKQSGVQNQAGMMKCQARTESLEKKGNESANKRGGHANSSDTRLLRLDERRTYFITSIFRV